MVEFFICLLFLLVIFNIFLTAQNSAFLVKIADQIQQSKEKNNVEAIKESNLLDINAPIQNYDSRFQS